MQSNNHFESLVETINSVSPFFERNSLVATQSWLLQHVPPSLVNLRELQNISIDADNATPEVKAICTFIIKQLSALSPLIANKASKLDDISKENDNSWVMRHLPNVLTYHYRLKSFRFLAETILGSDSAEINGKPVLQVVTRSLFSSSAQFAHSPLFTVNVNPDFKGFVISLPVFTGMPDEVVEYQTMAARLIACEKNRIGSDLGAGIKVQIVRVHATQFKSVAESIIAADFDQKALLTVARTINGSDIQKHITYEPVAPLTDQELRWMIQTLKQPQSIPPSIARSNSKYQEFGSRIERISLDYINAIQDIVDNMRIHLPTEKDELYAFLSSTPESIVSKLYNRDMVLVALFEDFGVNQDRQLLVKTKTKDLLIQLVELSDKENRPFSPIPYENIGDSFSLQDTEIH